MFSVGAVLLLLFALLSIAGPGTGLAGSRTKHVALGAGALTVLAVAVLPRVATDLAIPLLGLLAVQHLSGRTKGRSSPPER